MTYIWGLNFITFDLICGEVVRCPTSPSQFHLVMLQILDKNDELRAFCDECSVQEVIVLAILNLANVL